MFDDKTTRTQVLSGFLALMLILAGCSTADVSDESGVGSPEVTTIETTPTTTEDSAPKTAEMSLAEYASSSFAGANQAGLSDSQQAKVRDTVASFYNVTRNQTKRREASLGAAESICENDSEYNSRANVATLEAGGKASTSVARRLDFAAQIVNSELGGNVDRSKFRELRGGVGKATKYVPLLGSYNTLVDKSCVAAQQRTNESIEKFHIAALMFGVDAALVAGSVYYKPAFAGTRFVTNQASKVGLYRLRYLCGNRCWALAMSEIHWAMRGTMLGVTSNLARTAIEMGADLTEDDVRAVLKKQGYDPKRVLANSNVDFDQLSKCSSSVTSQVKNVTGDVAKEGGELLGNTTDDSGSGFGIGDVVNESKSALNSTRDAVSDQDVQSMVNKSESSVESVNDGCPGLIDTGE